MYSSANKKRGRVLILLLLESMVSDTSDTNNNSLPIW